jgi:hypothetical protein
MKIIIRRANGPVPLAKGYKMRVKAGKIYKFVPVLMDRILDHGAINLPEGTQVRVINLPSAPPCNTMGQCHIEHLDGTFIGMVCTNSLVKV